MIGKAVTSNSCIGTCRIFSIARHAKASEAASARSGAGGRVPVDERGSERRPRRARSSTVGGGHAASSSVRRRRRRGGRSGSRNTSSRLGWPRDSSATAMPARDRSARAAATPSASAARADSVAGSGSRNVGTPRAAESIRFASGRCSGRRSRRCSAARADQRLELAGRALGDDLAAVDDGDAVGELVGLVEVLGREQHGRAGGDEDPHDLPHLVAAAGVETGGRLVEEQQLGGDDDAGGDVEPAAHAARVGAHEPVGGVGQPERVEQLAGPVVGAAGGEDRRAGRRARGSRGRSAPRRPTRTGR